MPMLKTDSRIRKPIAVGSRHLSQTDALSKNCNIKQAPAISQRLRSEWYDDHPDEKKKFGDNVSLREAVAPRKKATKSKAAGSSRNAKKRALVDAESADSEANTTAQSKRTRMPSKPTDSPELPPHDSPEPSPDVTEPSTLSSDDTERCTRDLKKAASTLVTDNDSNHGPHEKFYTELSTFRGRFEDARTAEQIAVSLALFWYRQMPQAWTISSPQRAAHLPNNYTAAAEKSSNSEAIRKVIRKLKRMRSVASDMPQDAEVVQLRDYSEKDVEGRLADLEGSLFGYDDDIYPSSESKETDQSEQMHFALNEVSEVLLSVSSLDDKNEVFAYAI